jgi:hypothetical protein
MKTSLRDRRLVRASAFYDLVMTTPFATPWSAALLLGALRALHGQLGLPGHAPPDFAPLHLFFVSLLGTVVTAWSFVRLVRPDVWLGRVDGFTRLGFSFWMAWSLFQGQSWLIAGLLVVELGFGVAQLALLGRDNRHERRQNHLAARA